MHCLVILSLNFVCGFCFLVSARGQHHTRETVVAHGKPIPATANSKTFEAVHCRSLFAIQFFSLELVEAAELRAVCVSAAGGSCTLANLLPPKDAAQLIYCR